MYTETSNLNEFSKAHLSLLIECVDEKISTVKTVNAFTEMLINDEISEGLEIKLRAQIAKRNSSIDDLLGLRVAIMNAHQIVSKRERVNQN
jgi:hypothetical protein